MPAVLRCWPGRPSARADVMQTSSASLSSGDRNRVGGARRHDVCSPCIRGRRRHGFLQSGTKTNGRPARTPVENRRAGPTTACSLITRLRSAGVPSAMTFPWSITQIWSASASASSRYWVVSSTVTPPPARARIIRRTRRASRTTSRPPAIARPRSGRSGVASTRTAVVFLPRSAPAIPAPYRAGAHRIVLNVDGMACRAGSSRRPESRGASACSAAIASAATGWVVPGRVQTCPGERGSSWRRRVCCRHPGAHGRSLVCCRRQVPCISRCMLAFKAASDTASSS